ncbi:long-chain fatty acid--CoA ligase [Rhodococcus sp. IEGM 1379]|uniref:long-chain-fatty-acid--CoA ligase n=1 Tax=Rhodococcus sp. IEGM 1379 TaxID=3047086 RepID=UPI0024B64DC0|nr:long-chain fatty acid--CoA ligase [Rhodococcus sp. IEGM 1379]MDI9914190.1 long-chain fatty acid--CoA ligase [Rhodococcus sp. IEGM 1379]
MSFNLATMLRESRRKVPRKPLVYFGDDVVSYEDVDSASDRVAAGLISAGMERGARIAVQLPNQPEFLFAYFGILKAGLVMVPLNPLLHPAEVAYQLADSDASMLITLRALTNQAVEAVSTVGDVKIYAVGAAGSGDVTHEIRDFADLMQSRAHTEISATSADDTAVLLYTSGTTGKPKGAELTHYQLYMNCTVTGELLGYQPDDVSLAALPMFHVFGLSSVLNTAVRFGTTLALVPRFEIEPVLDTVAARRVTILPGVPTIFAGLLHADTSGHDLSSLRVGVSGGAAIPGELLRAFEEKFDGMVILEGYGLSESASVATFNVSAQARKVRSIGKPIWGVEIRLVDDQGTVLEAGEENIGELQISGHNIMKGYYNRPEATAEALRDGWFSTGDLGYRDEDDYYFIVDRKKDLVVRGGYNVYPREVEEILYTHPAVAEAAVIGEDHDRLGEEVVAVISLKPGHTVEPEDLVTFAKERMAAYKYPRRVTIIDTLPKGSTGKILKKELRAPSARSMNGANS